uniref:Uncharacterized protein n=1 Tax=Phenylobacterium glaciei TaxID=2803784 RepID=A0A974S924_9CAUL|nr:hypothetical protein JKL49_00240 [Phenylobacterium glaciei]
MDRYRFNAGGLTAQTRIKVKTGIGPVRDGAIAADGQLRVANGAIAFTASHCAPVSGRLELGANSVEAVETQLCPTGAPLFTLAKGDWHIRADAKALSAKVPFLQAAISQGAGRLDLGAIKGRLAGTLALTSGTVADTGADLRFNPVQATAQARVSGDVWRADITVADPPAARSARAISATMVRPGWARSPSTPVS